MPQRWIVIAFCCLAPVASWADPPPTANAVAVVQVPAPQRTGPFVVAARPTLIRAQHVRDRTCLFATFRVSIENDSPADVGLAIVGASLSGTDGLGFDLLPHPANTWSGADGRSGGIPMIYGVGSDWQKTIDGNKSAFLFLSSHQSTAAQIITGGGGLANCVDDKDSSYLKNHVVSTTSIAGAFAVLYPDGKSEQRGFSFEDVPGRITE